jgi:2-phospho-L-lactate guanylyltransferase
MQATVRSFDAVSHCGDVLLDDGTVKAFDARAFEPSGLRLLRIGQRVRLDVDSSGTVEFITIATMGGPDS